MSILSSGRGTLHTIELKLNQFLPTSVHGKTFLIITILESTVDIILESILIVRLNLIHTLSSSPTSQLDPTRTPLTVYLGIFILAHLFQLYFALDALRHKNTIQLIGLCCFNFALLVYAIIQVPEIKEIEYYDGMTKSNSNLSTSSILLLIIPICIAICQVAFSYLTWHLFKEFGWQIYKQIGADRRIKRIYLMYQIFMCLLKFDYFFFMAFSVQLVLLVPSVGSVERVLTIIALPTTLLLLVLGYYAARNEQKSIMASFMVGLLSGSSYFIYKLFRIWQGRYNPYSYENVFKSLTVFSVSCLLMTLLSFTSAIICLKNFGKGLKVQMDKNTISIHKGTPRRRIAVTTHQAGGFGDDDDDDDGLGRSRHYHHHSSSSSGDLSTRKGVMMMGGAEGGLVFELDGKHPGLGIGLGTETTTTTTSSVDMFGGGGTTTTAGSTHHHHEFQLSLGESIDGGGGYLSRHLSDHPFDDPSSSPSHPPLPPPPPFVIEEDPLTHHPIQPTTAPLTSTSSSSPSPPAFSSSTTPTSSSMTTTTTTTPHSRSTPSNHPQNHKIGSNHRLLHYPFRRLEAVAAVHDDDVDKRMSID